MKPTLIKFLLLGVLISGTTTTNLLNAQAIYLKENAELVQEKIEYLNTLLNDCKLEFKKKTLIAYFYKNGEKYREDRFFMETLDPENVSHSEEEGHVIVRCRKKMEGKFEKYNNGCIERHFFRDNIRRAYGRTNFDVGSSEEDIDNFERVMKELIKMGELPHDAHY